MARPANRREDILTAALEAFVDRGYEGTSVADLAEATGLTKAAFVYHFTSKSDLLFELAGPLLDELEALAEGHSGPDADDKLLAGYLDVLCRHRQVVEWIDGDKSILNHGDLGARLDANNRLIHELLAGPDPDRTARAQASAILGMLWRPMRNGFIADDRDSREAVLDMAEAALTRMTEGSSEPD